MMQYYLFSIEYFTIFEPLRGVSAFGQLRVFLPFTANILLKTGSDPLSGDIICN
jgi:hypothetical protein